MRDLLGCAIAGRHSLTRRGMALEARANTCCWKLQVLLCGCKLLPQWFCHQSHAELFSKQMQAMLTKKSPLQGCNFVSLGPEQPSVTWCIVCHVTPNLSRDTSLSSRDRSLPGSCCLQLVCLYSRLSSCLSVGLTVEGLFRVPGPQALIDELKEGFERGGEIVQMSTL